MALFQKIMENRAGKWILNLSGEAAYKSFRPAPLPPVPAISLDNDALKKLFAAKLSLAKLNVAAKMLPEIHLFVAMSVRKEALLSSQIEGTQCTLDDLLNPMVDGNANLDVADVVNYISAMDFARERLKTLPLCGRFLCELHAHLLAGIRGNEKSPGEFRRSQNWIGAANCTLREARYVPPNVDDMREAMSDLEKFLNDGNAENAAENADRNDDFGNDDLVRAALIHYQFETIHPFLDGNGRIGRMLILLYFLERKILDVPAIYVSYFLKKNQIEYYDRMSEVRKSGNFEQWISFFLEAIFFAADDALKTIEALQKLRTKNLEKLPKTTRSRDVFRSIFDYLERHPIIAIGKTAQALNLSFNTVAGTVKKLCELGILFPQNSRSRNRIFVYRDYLKIFSDGNGELG